MRLGKIQNYVAFRTLRSWSAQGDTPSLRQDYWVSNQIQIVSDWILIPGWTRTGPDLLAFRPSRKRLWMRCLVEIRWKCWKLFLNAALQLLFLQFISDCMTIPNSMLWKYKEVTISKLSGWEKGVHRFSDIWTAIRWTDLFYIFVAELLVPALASSRHYPPFLPWFIARQFSGYSCVPSQNLREEMRFLSND